VNVRSSENAMPTTARTSASRDGQRDRGLRVDGLRARADIAAGIVLEVTRRHGPTALEGEPRHPLAAGNASRDLDHLRGDVDRGLQDQQIAGAVERVHGPGYGSLLAEKSF
jgi:hypothetical protein